MASALYIFYVIIIVDYQLMPLRHNANNAYIIVSETPVTSSGWIFKRKSGVGCSLKSFDRYTFLMGVEFTSQYGPLAAIVTVTHKYYETMMTLKRNTTVSFDWLHYTFNQFNEYCHVQKGRSYIIKVKIQQAQTDLY